MSMFKTLAGFVAAAPVTLTIFPADDGQLRVIIAQKKEDGDKHVPLALAITGTPEELDAELPLAIAEGQAAPAKSIAEQVKEQVTASTEEEGAVKKKKPKIIFPTYKKTTTAKKPLAKKTAQKKTPPAKPVKPVAKKKTAPAKPAAPTIKPVITPLVVPRIEPLIRPMPPEKPANKTVAELRAEKRAECLDDLRAAKLQHGDKLTRNTFSKAAKTGRTFEKAFGSWEKFLAAFDAEAAAPQSPAEAPPSASAPIPQAAALAEVAAPVQSQKPTAAPTKQPDLLDPPVAMTATSRGTVDIF